jgi:hypothetical protein
MFSACGIDRGVNIFAKCCFRAMTESSQGFYSEKFAKKWTEGQSLRNAAGGSGTTATKIGSGTCTPIERSNVCLRLQNFQCKTRREATFTAWSKRPCFAFTKIFPSTSAMQLSARATGTKQTEAALGLQCLFSNGFYFESNVCLLSDD